METLVDDSRLLNIRCAGSVSRLEVATKAKAKAAAGKTSKKSAQQGKKSTRKEAGPKSAGPDRGRPTAKVAAKHRAAKHKGHKAKNGGSKKQNQASKLRAKQWQPCKLCGRTPEEVKKDGELWGQYDTSGQPVGAGCRLDLETLVEGWPGISLESAAEMLHSREAKTAGFRQEFPKAKRIKKDSGVLKSRFNPASSVRTQKFRFRMVYHDTAFLTDSELQNLTDVPVAALKVKTHRGAIQVEDRSETVQGTFLSLKGMPEDVRSWVRKVRHGYVTQVSHDEDRLVPDRQIRAEQGNLLFDFFSDKMRESAEKACRTKHRPSLPELSTLLQQAAAYRQENVADVPGDAEEDVAEGEQGEEEDKEEDPVVSEGEGPDAVARSQASKQILVQPEMTAAPSLEAGSFDVPTKASSTRQTGSKSGKGAKKKKGVIRKLKGKVYKCFHSLNPAQHLEKRARRVAETMRGQKASQHILLSCRVDLMEHVDRLVIPPNSIAKLSVPSLLASLHKLKDEDIELPFDLRLLVLERFTAEALDEIVDSAAAEDKKVNKALGKWLSYCSVSPASFETKTACEIEPTFAWAYQCMKDELAFALKTKKLAEAEHQQELKENDEVTAESLIDCLASEQFFSLLSAPDKKENRKKLQLMCESFLKAFFESKEKNIYQKLPDVVSRVFKLF
ncbi:hypothetical protein AK812_SmicGene41008 [Symbiodinium microadriaticum]|uniref:Uncharacterized protein n=1 Tax=Symbiodinium microadriaticum TaxID=2951 RepID=A0A1Q9C7A0_SYMMI|nr:hypothetical protein AK812_SmicGene41008 [Symbiodinium microadriaticum]